MDVVALESFNNVQRLAQSQNSGILIRAHSNFNSGDLKDANSVKYFKMKLRSTHANFNILDKFSWVHFELELEAFAGFQNKVFGSELAENLLTFGAVIEFIFGAALRRVSMVRARIRQQTSCDIFDFYRHIRVGPKINIDQDRLVKFHLILLESCFAVYQVGNVVQLDGDG